MKKLSLRMVSVLLAVVVMVSCVGVVAYADDETTGEKTTGSPLNKAATVLNSGEYDYHAYSLDCASVPAATSDLILDGSAFTADREAGVRVEPTYLDQKNVAVWESQKGMLDYTFTVPSDAKYNLTFTYIALDSSERDISLGFQIDGAYPFYEAATMELPRMWMDAGELRQDDYGNQFAPEQICYDGFTRKELYDASGASVYPIEVALTAGTHTVTVITVSESWVISEIALTIPDSTAPTYNDLKAVYEKNGYKATTSEPIFAEGEAADIKSTRSLVAYADNSSTNVTPSSATKSLINYIGNTNWKMPNEEIEWIVDVPEDGLYKLGFTYKQDQVINGFAYRHLRIDGKTPFAECSALKFDYTLNWANYEFGDENGAYQFYLTKGQHQLSLAGTMGDMADIYYDLKTVSSNIGTLYLDIIMITSESPDANRDYELFKTIPQFEERLTDYVATLERLISEMRALSGDQTSSFTAAMSNVVRVMNNMLNNRYVAQNYVTDFYSQYSTLSSWLYSMQEMALSIDRIELAPVSTELSAKKAGFFEKMGFGIQRFFISFSKSYSRFSVPKEGSVSVRIWVNWGRDQAQVLNNLINESFVPYAEKELGYSVSVNMELTSTDIIKGMLSNNAPDLQLHMARSEPVNLALRGALLDLKQFDDFETVTKCFGDTATIPYQYQDGVYALPDQQSFYLMFYRTDILEKLGLSVPQTWDEFLAASAVLQRNNMNTYLPYTKIASAGTVSTGVGGLNLFSSVLMQFGGKIYNDELNVCQLDTPTSLSAFTYWTDMYCKHKIPVEASFYNRFRIGTIPMGISSYTMYTTLAEAAPEITGRWAISLIPGIQKENGTIDRTISGSGTGCSILHTTEHPVEAWTFLKWWTSASTQSRYNTNVESILGTISRITTANLEAFENMSWKREDLPTLLEQRRWIVEVPEVPGSYYVSRSVDQAFWNVINNVAAPKDALTRWSMEANNEIKRKIAQYA